MVLAPGSPCWVEIQTAQPEATMRFYGDLLGWRFHTGCDAAGYDYFVATLDGEQVAGVRPVRRPPRDWVVFLATENLRELSRLAVRAGGTVVEANHPVPGIGHLALIESPAGAMFGASQVAPELLFGSGLPGTLGWAEFVTHNPRLADEFFGTLFRYRGQQFGDGWRDDYMVWYAGGESVLGRVRMVPGTPTEVPPRWIAHFCVPDGADFDDLLHRAHTAGARLRFLPYSSTLGRVAVLSDVTGTRFALLDPSQAAEEETLRSAADDPFDD